MLNCRIKYNLLIFTDILRKLINNMIVDKIKKKNDKFNNSKLLDELSESFVFHS